MSEFRKWGISLSCGIQSVKWVTDSLYMMIKVLNPSSGNRGITIVSTNMIWSDPFWKVVVVSLHLYKGILGFWKFEYFLYSSPLGFSTAVCFLIFIKKPKSFFCIPYILGSHRSQVLKEMSSSLQLLLCSCSKLQPWMYNSSYRMRASM